ncbi:spindle and centriole-associated protein 1 [Xyrichtys novacula]|uniref:Spindle and centriole-associated protein 1 n=1 Tax=Xyrichtys novacula TaxID=13765 RepID=A0AAV1H7Z6_XYRNO|nr:spindle and centriole-associated protein 1 [Xyrichtys novacula]
MSFVRVGRPQQQTKGKRPVRAKKAAATKKDWVSTVSDLSVHKLSPAELSHRHEIHKSHNKAAAQWELREKALKRRLRLPGSPAPLDHASLSIIREVFSDQLLLQDVLARSDRAMAVVKDLFGDAPRRQTGNPSVTVAPNCDPDSALPVLQRPDRPTQLSLLSQSMMDQQALNEVEAPEDCRDEDDCPDGGSDYEIRRANVQKMKALPHVAAVQKVPHSNSEEALSDHVSVTPCASNRPPDERALNATVAVQRVRSRQNQPQEENERPPALVSQVLNPQLPLNQSGRNSRHNRKSRMCVSQSFELDGSSFASVSGDQSSLSLLQAMLGQVEADLDTLSRTPEEASPQNQNQCRTQGLTGFSVALVSTLGRLVHLFKQREVEAQLEVHERRRLEEKLREQHGLIDALTTETMTLREEVAALQAGSLQQTAELEQKLDTVVLAMGGPGQQELYINPPPSFPVEATALQSAPNAEQPIERLQPSVSPAVLLSPPRQRDHLEQSSETLLLQLHKELPPVDTLHSCEAPSAASSLSQLSPDAILAEIAQLNEQNNLMRAHLSQAGSGIVGSSDSIHRMKRLSSGNTGRVTPTFVGERGMTVSSRSGRRSQQVRAAEGEQLISQATSLISPSVSSMEQRLLELNRQSAAARGRLLELIEQQKPSVSSKVSPSGSPIPLSAVSPPSVGMSAQSDIFTESDPPPYSHRGETKDRGVEMEQREREGWFALSTHVR